MHTTQNFAEETAGVGAQHATRALFFIGGFGIAVWAPIVPFMKMRLGIAEDMLGLLLLCIGVGSVIAMPLAGALSARFGCRRVLTVTGSVFPFLLLLLSFLDSIPVIVATLLVFGAVIGVLDAVVNIHAVQVEKASGKRLMSGMHGLWSVGGFAGAGLFGILLELGLSLFGVVLCLCGIIWLTLALFARRLLVFGGEKGGSSFAVPRGIVALIGCLAFVSFLAEGAVLDWSGVFLISEHHAELSLAGVGYAAFSVAMLIGRLGGDALVQRFGDFRMVVGGGLVAAAGFFTAIGTEHIYLTIGGFFLVGAGAANIVPVLFSLLGRQTVMPVFAAVSAVTALGYSGVLAGPAAMGFIAHATSLTFSFGFLGGLLLLQAVVSGYLFRVLKK